MSKERTTDNKGSSNTQNILKADAGLDQTVSEGSTVVLYGSGSPANLGLSYSWKPISDRNYDVNLDDENGFSKKIFDYSSKTIENLMDVGYKDALVQMDMQQMKDEVVKLAKRIDPKSKDNNTQQELEKSLYQIQERMKIENGHDIMLNKLVKDFIKNVESIEAKEEKVVLISLAKQLQDTINN